jgi:WD40 repeat protein
MVYSGSEDGKVYGWDLVDASVKTCFDAHSKPVSSLDYHPVLDHLVTGSSDGLVKIWHLDK